MAGFALVLAARDLFGVIVAYAASARVKVFRSVVGQGMMLALIGCW